MSDSQALKVVLCWHMHQPNYVDPVSSEYKLPWTYLHVIKDYVDMVAHLEAVPAARVVVNFAPILLEQIDDYARQVKAYLSHKEGLRDHLLVALVTPTLPVDVEQRIVLMKACLRINYDKVIKRFPQYQLLADMAKRLMEQPTELYYSDAQFIADLVTWYHLAWLGETIRRTDARVQRLLKKGKGFTLHDRDELMEIIGEQLSGVLSRYRLLAEKDQIELSFTPYAHPIMPLLLDINSAHEAMPDAPLPATVHYPGGEERVRWHIRKGLDVFERFFGFRPKGCWPSEGSVCNDTLAILAQEGLRWAASGENVMCNSLARVETSPQWRDQPCAHRPYLTANDTMNCFFRDDGLSDLIGFNYSGWHADDAVADFIHHLENIKNACEENDDTVVSVVLDGENAWEYYPENAYYFLSTLYQRLSSHPNIEMTTFNDCLDTITPKASLPKVVAGSWVYGTFSTWIGERDKNLGWDMLIEVKQVYDRALAGGRFSAEELSALERQLGVCEGSDWFWWFGDYNPGDAVSDFEQLYRLQLTTLYHMLKEAPPDYLLHSFTQGGGDSATNGAMRHGREGE